MRLYIYRYRSTYRYSYPLLDPEEVVEAVGSDNQKTQLKSMSFPLMDDPDALPSTYINKVLQSLSKWSCKLVSLCDAIAAVDPPQSSLDVFLFLIGLVLFKLVFPNYIIPQLSTCGLGYRSVLMPLTSLSRTSLMASRVSTPMVL